MQKSTIAMMGSIAFAVLLQTTPAGADITVAENFGGSGGNLNGTTAETFSSTIISAGGSNSWVAATTFKDDGSTDPQSHQSAYLDVGSYINDTKGTANGLFTLSATLTKSSDGNWGAIGFFTDPATNTDFTRNGMGLGVLIYRSTGELDGFRGPGTDSGVDGPDSQTGSQLLTVVLDLTEHDNVSDFGSVSFYQGTAESNTWSGTADFTSDHSFDAVALSQSLYDGTFADLQLSQVPEPATFGLLGIFGLVYLLRRKLNS